MQCISCANLHCIFFNNSMRVGMCLTARATFLAHTTPKTQGNRKKTPFRAFTFSVTYECGHFSWFLRMNTHAAHTWKIALLSGFSLSSLSLIACQKITHIYFQGRIEDLNGSKFFQCEALESALEEWYVSKIRARNSICLSRKYADLLGVCTFKYPFTHVRMAFLSKLPMDLRLKASTTSFTFTAWVKGKRGSRNWAQTRDCHHAWMHQWMRCAYEGTTLQRRRRIWGCADGAETKNVFPVDSYLVIHAFVFLSATLCCRVCSNIHIDGVLDNHLGCHLRTRGESRFVIKGGFEFSSCTCDVPADRREIGGFEDASTLNMTSSMTSKGKESDSISSLDTALAQTLLGSWLQVCMLHRPLWKLKGVCCTDILVDHHASAQSHRAGHHWNGFAVSPSNLS